MAQEEDEGQAPDNVQGEPGILKMIRPFTPDKRYGNVGCVANMKNLTFQV